MAFLFPSFLWALTALAIPVIIHLFQLRRFKRLDFPNVQFLDEVSKRTRSRRQVRHWLVLAARLLALTCLVFAFAQPYIPGSGRRVKAGQRAVSLFLDNSWSMDGTNAQGRLLDQARKDAQEAVLAFKASDRFQVITNTFEGRQQFLLGRDEALEAAGQVEVGPFSRPLSQVLARQRDALGRSDAPVKEALLFTDLQRSACDVAAWTNDSLVPTTIVPLPAGNVDNLAIDSVWFSSPVRRLGQNEVLHVRIRNFGDHALENIPLHLTIDGRQRAMATFAAAAKASVDTVLRFTNDATGRHWGEIGLADHPVTFDDRFFIAYRTAERLRVLLVSGSQNATQDPGDRSIAAVFQGDSTHAFAAMPYRQLDLAQLATTDLLVLNGPPDVPSGTAAAIKEFVQNGGSLAVFPADKPDAASWNAFLGPFSAGLGTRDTAAMKVDRIDLQQPFYADVFSSMPKNVDLPLARARFGLHVPPTADVLLRMQNGTPFLAALPAGKGTVYLCAAPLTPGAGGFMQHALFVTSLLRMAELARPMGALYHTLGAEAAIPLEGITLTGESEPHLKGPEGSDLVPEVRRTLNTTSIVLHDEDLAPGPYALVMDRDTLTTLALDLPRQESDLAAYTPAELQQLIDQRGLTSFRVLPPDGKELSAGLLDLDRGHRLWKWSLIAALAFLALEILFIRTLP